MSFFIGRDFLAKRSVSVSYKSVSYMRDPTVTSVLRTVFSGHLLITDTFQCPE